MSFPALLIPLAAAAAQPSEPPVTTPETAPLPGRRRPGVPQRELEPPVSQENPGALRAPPPEAFPTDQIPVPDRWRLVESLGLVRERWFDPYRQNRFKGDRPVHLPWLKGDAWFLNLSAVSDTVVEPRTFPVPVGVQTTRRPDSLDVFGRDGSLFVAQTFILGASLFKGSTAFMPPHVEYRLSLAFNLNHARVAERRILFVQPSKGTRRTDAFVGVQEAFVDYHLRDVSARYDFDSVRVGIQPFQLDFRGFLFNDQQLGVRLFGNRKGNRYQYNLAAIWRLEKDTDSGLNSVLQSPRKDWILHANLYRQDFPVAGFTSQASLTWNANRERGDVKVDENGFPVRPALIGNVRARSYDVVYLGYNGDGHFGRLNLTASAYAALGSDRANIFTGRTGHVRAFFAAAEPSYDMDWIRLRGSFLYASGDRHPFDDRETGFDTIFENPIFAGADTSYWIRQSIPFAGGARAVVLNGRNAILNSLRSSKEQGQSNFNNPGTILAGAGADFDVLPELRLSTNLNHLWFADTAVLQALRSEGSIPRDIGWDASLAAIWRPKFTQNLVFRASGAMLVPGAGFRDLFANSDRRGRYVSVLLNAIVTY